MANPETTLTRSIRRALEDRGAHVIKVSGGAENAGAPDLVVMARRSKWGYALAIGLEVKTAKGKVSKLQEHNLQRIRAAGGIAEVVRSVEEALEVVFPGG